MTEFQERIKNKPKAQEDVDLCFDESSKESNKTQFYIGQKSLVLRKYYEAAIETMGETIEHIVKKFKF